MNRRTIASAMFVLGPLALPGWNSSDGEPVRTTIVPARQVAYSAGEAVNAATLVANADRLRSDLDQVSPGCVGWLRNVRLVMDPPEWVKSSRIGQVQRLSAKIIKGTDRNTGNLTVPEGCRQLVWETSDPQVASVSQEGLVRALRRGNVTITATDLFGGHSESVDLVIESGVPSNQPVNMYTTWTARRLQHAVVQVNDQIFTVRNKLLDMKLDEKRDGSERYPPPWTQGGIEKYHWYNDRIGLLSDVVDGAGSLRVVERASEWTVLAKANAVDFQLFRQKIILLDDSGALRVKIAQIDDPWNEIASSGIRQFRAHMDSPDEVITVVREDGLLFGKVINGDNVYGAWIPYNVGGQVERVKVFDQYIAVLRTDGVFGVFDRDSFSWTPLVASGVRDFAYSPLGVFVLFEDGRLRGKAHVHANWADLATDVDSFTVDGRLVAAQQNDGPFRVKKELNGPWRVLSEQGVLGYALQVDETGEYIGYVGSDRFLAILEGVDGDVVITKDVNDLEFDRLPEGEIGHITVVADVREPPTRTISTSYPGGSRNAAPPEFGLSSYLRSYPDDQYQCMLDNTVPVPDLPQCTPGNTVPDSKTHYCRWVSELCFPVACYGRFCGAGVPSDDDQCWANNVGSLDSFDQLCRHHDNARNYYPDVRDGLFDACIVKYGIVYGRLTYNGRQVVDGDPDWSERWATMWNLSDAIDNYTALTSGCFDRIKFNQFVIDTASPRTQEPPE